MRELAGSLLEWRRWMRMSAIGWIRARHATNFVNKENYFMTQRHILAVAILAGASAARTLPADDYALDNAHTSVIFGISHLGFSFTYGRFDKASGTYTLDPAHPEN